MLIRRVLLTTAYYFVYFPGIYFSRTFSFSLSLSFFLSLFRNYLVTRLVFRFPPLSPLSLSILRVCEFSPPLPPLSRAGEREIRVLIDLRGILIL